MSYYINALTKKHHGYINYVPVYNLKESYDQLSQTRNEFVCKNFSDPDVQLLNEYYVFQTNKKHKGKKCVYGNLVTYMLDRNLPLFLLQRVVA